MNKKIISVGFLLIVLVSITVGYAIFTQPGQDNTTPTDASTTIDGSTIASEISSQLLDENQDIEIGEMI